MYRIKIIDPHLNFPIYSRKVDTEGDARKMGIGLYQSDLLVEGTIVVTQKKSGWFKWEDVSAAKV